MYQDTDNITTLEAHMATNTSTIRAGAEIFTLINVFSVAPDHQQELANVLIEATEHTMRHLPGFISANIHTSFDGRHVVNDARWRARQLRTDSVRGRTRGSRVRSMAGACRFWIGVASRDHVDLGVEGHFVQLNHGQQAAVRRLKAGDGVIVYSPRTAYPEGKRLQPSPRMGRWAAAPEINSPVAPTWFFHVHTRLFFDAPTL